MLALLHPIARSLATPSAASLSQGMANDFLATGTYAYNRNTSDSKIDYMPSENTHIFGKYSIEPFTITDPQGLGAAGGSTMDGGQPGATAGRIQNAGLGVSHVISASLVLDADFGYTRQNLRSAVHDRPRGRRLRTSIPSRFLARTANGNDYAGQPIFSLNNTFSTLGNAQTANPFQVPR